jgi:hypothetical protein
MTIPGPYSGDDTYDLITDALTKLAQRRGAWPGGYLTAITLLASLIDQAGRCLPNLAGGARIKRAYLGPDRPRPGHQPRASTPALRPGIPHH